jgi:hypothetical protein
MKKYIQARLDWIAKQFVPLPKLEIKKQDQGSAANLSSAGGQILFTLDGTDPRASGGAPTQSAQVYKSAIQLKPGARFFARVRDGERWSGPLMHTE